MNILIALVTHHYYQFHYYHYCKCYFHSYFYYPYPNISKVTFPFLLNKANGVIQLKQLEGKIKKQT